MTTTPYDSLPSGNNHIMPVTAPIPEPIPQAPEPVASKYVDVELSPPPTPVVETLNPQPPAKTIPISPSPQYSTIHIKNLTGRCEYVLPFEESLLVPDTMPDMQKVLFAEGRVDPAQPSKLNYDRNDFLAGDITAYTVYKPVPSAPSPSAGPAAYNNCPVDVIRSVIPFKTDKCWSDAIGDSFKPAVTILSISAEMINERKFIVKGELLIRLTCFSDCEIKVLEEIPDEDLMMLKSPVKATGLDRETTDHLEISQDITLKEEQLAPTKILKASVRIAENHRQLTSGKLVVNGSIYSEIFYIGENNIGEKNPCFLTHKTDFTQFIVMDDKIDPDLVCIDFYSGGLSLAIESKDKFILSGKIITLINAYCTKHVDIVKDAYHKKKDLRFRQADVAANHITHTVNGEISAREVINISADDRRPAALLCGSYKLTSVTGHMEKDRIVIEGSMPVKILALDEEDIPFVIEHNVPIRGALALSGHPGANPTKIPSVYIDTSVKEFWFSEINSRQLEVNTVLTMTARVIEEKSFCTIDDLCFAETDAPEKRVSMALYVVAPDDTLWNIAKRYKTDMVSLAALNEIDPEKPLPAGTKLFVSK